MEIILILLYILLAVLILGAIAYVLDRAIERPWSWIILGVIVVVLLILLLGSTDGLELGNGNGR